MTVVESRAAWSGICLSTVGLAEACCLSALARAEGAGTEGKE